VFAPVRILLERSELEGETPSFTLDLVEGLPFEPSDSTPFLREGVPAFYWSQSGKSDYEHYHHTQYDHADAVIDSYQRHSALVVAIAAWNLANQPELLDRSNLEMLEPRRMGAYLEGNVVVELAARGVAETAGVLEGDRIVEIEGQAIADDHELVAALQRGGTRKRVVVERGPVDAIERVELELDWTDQADEAERQRRRSERAEKFPIELRPWDE